MTRREVIGHLAALGAGAAVAAAPRRVAAQPTKAPMKLSFWTWENPQQRPWLKKRIDQYTQQYPNISVEFQYFAFSDLGKKVSVGYATGTAPDGFTTGDWLMPTWLTRKLIAPLDVQRLGYPSLDAFRDDHAPAFVAGAIHEGKVVRLPPLVLRRLQPRQHQAVQGGRARPRPRRAQDVGAARRGRPAAHRQGGQQVHPAGVQVGDARLAVDGVPVQPHPAAGGRAVVRQGRQVHGQQRGGRARDDDPRVDRQEVRRRGPRRLAGHRARCRGWTGSRSGPRCSARRPSARRPSSRSTR